MKYRNVNTAPMVVNFAVFVIGLTALGFTSDWNATSLLFACVAAIRIEPREGLTFDMSWTQLRLSLVFHIMTMVIIGGIIMRLIYTLMAMKGESN